MKTKSHIKSYLPFLCVLLLCLSLLGIMTACQGSEASPGATEGETSPLTDAPGTKAPETEAPDGTSEETQGETQPSAPDEEDDPTTQEPEQPIQKQGLVSENGKLYFYNDDGTLFTDGYKVVTVDGKRVYYYFQEDGILYTGWLDQENGRKYTFMPDFHY